MYQIKTSDVVDSTMVAKSSFDNILDQLQSSNSNFKLQVSPFSATISLRKSMIKDKNGVTIMPKNTSPSCLPQIFMSEIAALKVENQKLESEFMNLKTNYDNLVEDSQELQNNRIS